jgi:cytochrome c
MLRFAAALAVLSIAASPALAQDGAKLFDQRCKVCHTPASTPMGPALKGVYGAKIASRPGFKYSPALSAKDGPWNDALLDTWLSGPFKFAPGTRMSINVPAAADRTALIGYLKTLN